ncbi:MAG: ATP-binding cassette domain-containing protein, partial [Pseudomonadota bacterium]
MLDTSPVADIRNLRVEFETKSGTVVGVKDVSFTINPGETVCVVGESGSGKSVSSLSLMRLVEFGGGKIAGGELLFDRGNGNVEDMRKKPLTAMRDLRGNAIGMIFQEPMTSLNPVFTCGQQVDEALRLHKKLNKKEAKELTLDWFRRVQLPRVEDIYASYPHEISGGQKQRVMIAM